MTKLFEEAIAAVSQLSEAEQDAIASLILEELASEQRWNKAFAKSEFQVESDFSDYLLNLEDYENRLARGEIKW
jgi:dipeptidase